MEGRLAAEWLATARFLLSKNLWDRLKNLRDGLQDLNRHLRRSSNWMSDIQRFAAKIRKDEDELAYVFGKHIRSYMKEQKFSARFISDFFQIFQELVQNGLQHGCVSDADSITIVVSVFNTGVVAEFINNNKSKLIPDLASIDLSTEIGLGGRGIRTAMKIADEVIITRGGRGIKVRVRPTILSTPASQSSGSAG
jgi:hypothetical protein